MDHAREVGEVIYVDLHAVGKNHAGSIGGIKVWLMGEDENSGAAMVSGLRNKTWREVLLAIDEFISGMNACGHTVKKMGF